MREMRESSRAIKMYLGYALKETGKLLFNWNSSGINGTNDKIKKQGKDTRVKWYFLLWFDHKIVSVDFSLLRHSLTLTDQQQMTLRAGGGMNFVTSQSLWLLGSLWSLRARPLRLKAEGFGSLSWHQEFKLRNPSCDLWPLYFTIVFFYFLLFIFYISIYYICIYLWCFLWCLFISLNLFSCHQWQINNENGKQMLFISQKLPWCLHCQI